MEITFDMLDEEIYNTPSIVTPSMNKWLIDHLIHHVNMLPDALFSPVKIHVRSKSAYAESTMNVSQYSSK